MFNTDESFALHDALRSYYRDHLELVNDGHFAINHCEKDSRENAVNQLRWLSTATEKLGAHTLSEDFAQLADTIEELGEPDPDGRTA